MTPARIRLPLFALCLGTALCSGGAAHAAATGWVGDNHAAVRLITGIDHVAGTTLNAGLEFRFAADFVVVDDPAVRDRGYGRLSEAGAAARRRCERFSRGQEDLIWPTPLRFVLGDPRWKACFPQATTEEWDAEYRANNEAIFLCSLGAAIQNIQLGERARDLPLRCRATKLRW